MQTVANAQAETTAQKIAAIFGDDGAKFRIDRPGTCTCGTPARHAYGCQVAEMSIVDACRERGAEVSYFLGGRHRGIAGEPVRFDFEDGSAIVEIDGRWDLAAPGCPGFCWAGAGCECEESE